MIQPGGEAEQLGVQYTDKVVRVGDRWVHGEEEIKAVVAQTAARPLAVTVARKKPGQIVFETGDDVPADDAADATVIAIEYVEVTPDGSEEDAEG